MGTNFLNVEKFLLKLVSLIMWKNFDCRKFSVTMSKFFLETLNICRKLSTSEKTMSKIFCRKFSCHINMKKCRKFSMVHGKTCRKISVEKFGVEKFAWEMQKSSVEKFLSKIVMFAIGFWVRTGRIFLLRLHALSYRS